MTRSRANLRRLVLGALAAAALGMAGLAPAHALDKIRVGKAVPNAYSFTPLDIGMAAGIFKKHGLEIQEFGMGGSSKLQQALIGKSLDIGIGSGPELNFILKGAPNLGVAEMAGPPKLLVVLARNDEGIKTAKDLKGKKVSVSTVGGLTYWLAQELGKREGLEGTGYQIVPLGRPTSQAAALRSKSIDAMLTDLGLAFRLEHEGVGHRIVNFGDLIHDFIIHVIYTRKDFAKDHPDQVRAFLAGWFETIAYMKTHKAESVKVAGKVMNTPPDATGKIYDELMTGFFSTDGKFSKAGLQTLAKSFVEMGWQKTMPDLSKTYTEEFLPDMSKKGM